MISNVLAVHDEDAWRPRGAVLAAAEGADVYAFWTATDRVVPRIVRLLEHLLGLRDLVNLRPGGIGLRIHDINARGAKPADDQVALFEQA